MHNLNLYNSYDKSLADLNREFLESAKFKNAKTKSNINWKKRIIISSSFLALSAIGFSIYLGVISKPKVVVKPPPPPDLRSEEEKLGYVQIQIFEFDETAPSETINELVDEKEEIAKLDPNKNNNNQLLISQNDNLTDNTSNNIVANKNIKDAVNNQFKSIDDVYAEKNKELLDKIEVEKKKHKEKLSGDNFNPINPYEIDAIENQRKINEAEQAKKKDLDLSEPKKVVKVIKKAPPPPPPPPKMYSIYFEDIGEEQFKKVKSMTEAANATIDFNRHTTTILIWEVYEKNNNNPNNPKFLKEFLRKEDAYSYATSLKTPAVLKQIGKSISSYNVTVCCLEIDKAKKLAKDTKITDKIIKIKRKK